MDNNSEQPHNPPKAQPQNSNNTDIRASFGGAVLEMHTMNQDRAAELAKMAIEAAVKVAAIKGVTSFAIAAVRTLDASNPAHLDSQPFLDTESEEELANAPSLHLDLGIQVSLEQASSANIGEAFAIAAVRTLDASNSVLLDSQPLIDTESEEWGANEPSINLDPAILVSLEPASPENSGEAFVLTVRGASDVSQDMTNLGTCLEIPD